MKQRNQLMLVLLALTAGAVWAEAASAAVAGKPAPSQLRCGCASARPVAFGFNPLQQRVRPLAAPAHPMMVPCPGRFSDHTHQGRR
ncbi:MAG: hypothetical protein ABSA97_07695 [Verrucomicrobiia bacterium]